MTTSVKPMRYLGPAFLDALDELASRDAGWWRDVIGRPDLFLAVRRDSINVYFRGASIFRIDWEGGRAVPYTHLKYLINPAQEYARLEGDDIFMWKASEMVSRYRGPETLEGMIQASKRYAGPEKAGLHPMLLGNSDVIDTEIALTQIDSGGDVDDEAVEAEAGKATRKQDRIDAATARIGMEGAPPKIHFYEAKHFTNAGIRSRGDSPAPVVAQIERYGRALQNHADALSRGYVETARALLRFNEMRKRAFGERAARTIAPAIRQIADGEGAPEIDFAPRLIIYGYDNAQRIGESWKKHLRKLKSALPDRVRTIGNPTTKTRFLTPR